MFIIVGTKRDKMSIPNVAAIDSVVAETSHYRITNVKLSVTLEEIQKLL